MSDDQKIREPAPRPCGSCPYRKDTPSGVWSADEYDKLPDYDRDTAEQPLGVFMCHQQDGCVCAGWAALADVDTLALRFAVSLGAMTPEVADAVIDYTTDVELYTTGTEAAEAGKAEVEVPGTAARSMVAKLDRKLRK